MGLTGILVRHGLASRLAAATGRRANLHTDDARYTDKRAMRRSLRGRRGCRHVVLSSSGGNREDGSDGECERAYEFHENATCDNC